MRLLNQSLVLVLLLFGCQQLYSQDVEALIKEAKGIKEKAKATLNDSLKITGGITAQLEANYISGIPRRSDPFNYRLGANVNFSIYGLSLPLSFNYANKKTVYRYDLPSVKLPRYSFAGMSPSYKWATLHLGDRSMTFSPYTLSGHGFRGVGAEVKPGKVYAAAMYGRLRRADAQDLNSTQDLEPAYKRMAYGVKAGYDTGTEHIFAILFKGWDEINSLSNEETEGAPAPTDNTTISLQVKKQLTKIIFFSVDYALSAFNNDTRAELADNGKSYQSMLGLFEARVNADYFNAIKSSVALKLKWGELSLNHEWVEPGYRTLGALFFNNDFENYTIGTNTQLFDKKLSLSSNIGVERNNLRKTETNTAIRVVGSLNSTLQLGERLSINTSYSNFKNTSKQGALSQTQLLVDSIVLSQVNQSATLTATYINGEDKNSTTSANFSLNQSNSILGDSVQSDQSTTSYVASLTHSYVFTESKLALTAAILSNINKSAMRDVATCSPTVGIKRPFMKGKLQVSSSFSYILMFNDNIHTNTILNWQPGVNYIYKKKHNFGLMFSLIDQKMKVVPEEGTNQSFIESIGRLNYSWSF